MALSVEYKKVKNFLHENGVFFTNRNHFRLKDEDRLTFEKNLEIERGVGVLGGLSLPLRMGVGSYSWSALNNLTHIGRYCSIAAGLRILGPRHPIEALTSSSIMYDKHFSMVNFLESEYGYKHASNPNTQKPLSIVIGNDVWIGANVTLPRNIYIGDGAVIASNSVITKDVMPYTMVGGNPAKVIKSRFEPEVVKRLLASRWWDYNLEELSSLNMNNPEAFLDRFNPVMISKLKPQVITSDQLIAIE
ncbi:MULTISPECIES: CatB-related O-acetyltransferase [Psychrobacter]|uniref:CatB-related O-acetyltransferase n=1 Tax=Psychrobacter TaxID=497 RepID=UPI000EDD5288|nr:MULTISPECIES: CatB-related O-acetyltransferase [Psychrobacter]HCH27493.1 capsular biosynthesis protein [Psychrobacter sp.]